ncbi:hypothetical protein VNO78_03041 [Psophocarpus tetragonolobus]|uniref:Uncharacterized protein n=1 Tax=Psophocarpus tetragonolobus TaxID=3891 RepID=A0AAN9SZW8_PSOTE
MMIPMHTRALLVCYYHGSVYWTLKTHVHGLDYIYTIYLALLSNHLLSAFCLFWPLLTLPSSTSKLGV